MTALAAGKLRRLGAMDAAELGWRLRERLRRGVERVGLSLDRLTPAGRSEERFLRRLPEPGFAGYLRDTAARRFYLPAGRAGRDELAELVCRHYPDRLAAIAVEADRLCAHRFEVLGFGEVDCGPEIDWHRDPVTGAVWERRFWADYDLVGGGCPGDPKRVHELNRHQHLPRLGKAYLLLGEERWAEEAVAQMLGWIDQNPPRLGVHWHSSLEIALRALSWLWALFFIAPSAALDERAARRIGGSLFAQLDHVHAYPSVFTSPNTHLIGEAAALLVAGRVLGDCAGAGGWRRRGAELVAGSLDRQVLADGVHGELATCYHCYAVDFYLQALALGSETAGDGRLRSRVEAMLDFLLHVVRPDGTLPRLGDDDGGRALALAETSYRDAADLLATGAVLLDRGDLKARAGAMPEAAVWLLGAGGWRAYQRLPAAAPTALAASFPAAGYFVRRSGWGVDDAHLVFDCGGLGTLGGGHGHADALSLTLSAYGRPLLVDPGTFVYNGLPAWRDGFRSTAAHNTAVVDGRDQSEPGGTFRWRRPATARLLAEAARDGLDYLAGEHHGYAGAGGVVHRRRLLYVRPGYWLVLDDFRGDGGGEHTFELMWHLAPGAEAAVEADAVAAAGAGGFDDGGADAHDAGFGAGVGGGTAARLAVRSGVAGLALLTCATAGLEIEVSEGGAHPLAPPGRDSGPQPGGGWVSRRYGEKRAAPVIAARMRCAAPAAAVTVLVPHPAGEPPAWTARPVPLGAGGGRSGRSGSRGGAGWDDDRRAAGDPRGGTADAAADAPGTGAAPQAALAAAIAGPDGEDLVVLSPGGGRDGAEIEIDTGATRCRLAGEALWARLDAGRPRRLLAVDAHRLELDGEPLIDHHPTHPPRSAPAPERVDWLELGPRRPAGRRSGGPV